MSELTIEPEMPEEKLKELPLERQPPKGRLDWVDMTRGFVMLYFIVTISFPGDSSIGAYLQGIPIIGGLFMHAAAETGRVTAFDLGTPLFIFILGFTMPISFRKRKEEKGNNAAVKYILFRYLILFVLGFVIANFGLDFAKYYSFPFDSQFLYQGNVPLVHRPILFIINWDVIFTIAISGLIGFLFMGVRNTKYRFFLGYGWLFLYQFGLSSTTFQIYALQSEYGGFFSALFGYGSIAIIATAMGDYIFFSDTVATKKMKGLLVFGAINFVVPLVFYLPIANVQLQFFIEGFPISWQLANFSFVLTAIGMASMVLWGFQEINARFKKNAPWLRMFGMSSFFLYFIVRIPDTLFQIITTSVLNLDYVTQIPWWLSLSWAVVVITYSIVTAWILRKKNKQISTVKSSLIFLVAIIGILLIVIVLELTVGLGYLAIFN
ncbi:MAG: hypothetical protein EU530_07530 [Promethearchaeota archaeon]|nr:MAG: hypothetical protein EU530_07530 [Candidatus Lokiarchaeota archaeon]